MNSIDLMVQEHTNILRMLKVVRKACHKILFGDDICYKDFEKMIDFIRSYADAHHHGKEEQFLFKDINKQTADFEQEAEKQGTQSFYKELLGSLENKYFY